MRSDASIKFDISTDAGDNFCGLFIQDNDMRETFEAYPEIIFVEATYKLVDLQFSVYLLACEDSNGVSEITFTRLVIADKNKNPSVMFTKLVMADKDMNEKVPVGYVYEIWLIKT